MPADPYQTLRVPRTATPERIRRAYRTLALKLHPDRGGDPAAFQAATEAHAVLSDPERRARYDATGEIDERPAAHPHADLMAFLAPVLFAVLEGLVKQGRDLKRAHVVEEMRKVLRDGEQKLKQGRAELLKIRAGAETAAGRFTVWAGEENLLASAARAHLAHVDHQLAELDAEVGRVTRALEYLNACGYTVDPALAGAGGSHGGFATGASRSFFTG